MARAFGFEALSCASTGNLANAAAAHAAKAGMPCYVFVPEDLEPAKILATETYGAKVVAVKGNYDDVNRLCAEVADALPWAFVNVNMRPYYAEGSKTLGFETAEQLGWRLPDHVVVPIASGALLTKIHRAFQELIAIGAVEATPYRVSGAQPEGCRPVAQAFQDGAEEVTPVKPDTIARSLAIGSPADGYFALEVARETGGAIEWCTEAEILEGIELLASTEGVFTETAGGRHDRQPQAPRRPGRDPTRRGGRGLRDRERLQDGRGRSRAAWSRASTSLPTSTSSSPRSAAELPPNRFASSAAQVQTRPGPLALQTAAHGRGNRMSVHEEQARSRSSDLERFGYKQELKRDLGTFSSFAVAFSYISPSTGIFTLFFLGMSALGRSCSGRGRSSR